MDDNIKKLHQALIDDGYDDVGTEQEFRDYVSDSKNVATLYNALSEAGYDNFKDQKSLETYLSAKAPVAQKPSTPQSSGQSVSSKEKEQSQYPQEVKRGELKKPSLISQALGMMPKVDAGNIGREQKVGGMIANMLLGDNMQVQQPAQKEASPESKEAAPVTTPTGVVNNEGLMDAKLANYIEDWKQRPDKQSSYFENMVADLLADGTANSNEEAVNMVMPALHRYANRSAMDVTNQVVSSLPDDTVQDAEQSIGAQWYSHGVQDKLKQEADSMGISYDDYVAHYLKPAMVQSLVNKYGPNYRDIAEGIATRLYSHDKNVQDRLMNQDIDEALSDVISKYTSTSVAKAIQDAEAASNAQMAKYNEQSKYVDAASPFAIGAITEANKTRDPQKILSGLQQKFGKLYRNPEFLNDMSNAAFKVMQRYGLNGTLNGDPKQFKPMINAAIKNELDQLEVKGMIPRGSADYILKTGIENTIIGKVSRKLMQTDYQNWLEDIANQQYQPGFWENVASGALTFAGDAWSYWLPGAAGGKLTKSMVAKAEGKLAGDLIAKGMERKMAERAAKVLIGKSKAAALKSGAVHGAVTFGGQSAISKPIDEVYRTGQFDENGMIYNPSVGKVIANTLGEVAKQTAVGAILQGGTIANMIGKGRGLATNILADVGGKVVDSGIMTGQQLLERMAHDPNFKPTGKDAAESFLESMANLTAIGLPGMVGKYARFKDAREFNKKFDFTDQDIAELKRFGYDGLRDAFEKMGIGEYAVVGENAQRLDGQLTQKYMDLMNDKSVPEVLKAKMMAVVEGKRPSSFSPVVDSIIVQPMDHDGKVYLEILNKDGGIVDRKEFSSLDEAQKADKKLEYEKTLGLASVLEGEFHNEFTQEHLEGLYNKAAQKYNMGEKLTDEDKAAVYLHQNAGAIKDIMDKQQKGIILTDEEQKQINAYRHYYDSALENSSVMREFVNTFEDSHGVARGTLRKALESKDKKYAPLVESYLKELYNSIELKREMKQTMDDLYNTAHGNEQKRIEQGGVEGEKPTAPVEGSAGGQEPPVSEGFSPYQGNTDVSSVQGEGVSTANSDNSSADVITSDAFVMGQNAYKNGDSEALQAIDYNSDLATGRLKRAFADNEKMPDIVANAYNEGRDMEQFVAQRASSLTPAQKEAIRKYVEAMDAKKGAIDALQHADDGYGEALKEQLWPYQTEDGNIVPATLDSGKQVFLKKDNEYGGAFVVVPDEQGLPTIKQVSKASIIEKGTPVPLDEYIENAVTQQKDARNKQFISQFDATSLKPNDTVSLSINDKDQPTEAKIVSVNPDGTISFNIAGSKNVTTVPVDTFNKFQKYALRNSINAELDAEDVERAEKEAIKAEADKKQRYANGIVGLSEGQPDYSSKDTDPNVAAEYLQEQFGEDHGKLLNLVNGSRDDIKTQLANRKKAAAEYQNWLDTNADLDPEKAKKVEDELSLVNEQIADLDARFKNWNTIRNSVMTPDELRTMKEERKAEIEKAGVDKSSVLPDVDTGVRIPENSELKDKYPTQEAASGYITSERRRVYKMQEETQREIDGVDKILNQYMDGDIELSAEQLRDLNTTKAELANRQNALTADAKALKGKAESLNILYIKERAEQNKKNLEALSPKDRRKELVAKALEKKDMKAIKEIYKDASTDVMDLTPRTLEEFVSERLFPHSLNAESLAQELGSSNFRRGIGSKYDTNKYNYLLANNGEGLTISELAKRVWEDLSSTMESGAGDGLQSTYSDQDVRNAILDMFKTYDSVREMRNVTLLNRIAAAENELSGEEEWYEQQKEREIIERQAEIEKYQSYIHDKELSLPSESELDHINGLEFDRMMEIEDREREYKQYVKSILPELADYDDRSNEEGYGGGSSLGSDSSRRGVDEGNSQGEEVGNGEASSESEIGEGSDSGRKGRQETGSMEPGEGSAVRGSHLPQEASFGERLKSAIAETETEPTEAQKKAGNYKKGHLSFGGYDFTVETPKGVTRSGKDEQGKPWSVTMHDTYGYILGKIGVDGDHIDMFINDAADLDTFDGNVYVVDQVNPETGEFDEHKVMYGYPSEEAATEAYLANYSKGWKGLGKVTSVPKATFDKLLESSDRKTKPFADYAMVQKEQAKFDRDVKEVKPSEMTEAQKVAYDAVSTMLKKAGIPVKVVSNEDMEKVAEAQGKGVVYGYTDGKEIVLNQEHLNPNTPIHEYQHLWRTAAKNMNPELIEHGDKLIMQTQLFADLKQDPNYNHLTDEQICDEAFARLTGEDGAAILEQMAKDAIKENPLDTAKELSVINKLKEWLKKFWYWTLDTFTKWKPEDIKKMTLEDIRNLVLRDLANGVDPRNVKSRMTKEDAVSLRKQMADNAEQERILEHTEENWLKEFGKDSRVTTPIGSIKLGENQYKKAGRNDRIKRFGLLKPTLERPDVILEKSAPKEGAERQTKYLFIKSFKKADGNKILNYESITVKQGEEEVAISAHQIDPSKVLKELTESKVLWNRFRGDSNSLGENQGSALTPSANNPSGKDSVLNPHSDANIRNNIETTKGNGGNLSVEDKIKAVSQQFGVDEADVAMYANAVKKGSTAEAARARANIKRHLLQVNEDKISSLKELLKYTVPVNNALKENFGDLDAMIEERVKQVEAQRNAMEAARKRAEEEEAKRQKHLEELSVIPDDQLDKQYMDALAKGDDATAREMLDEAARRKGYDDTESAYQGVGAWAAPGNPGYESDKARRDDWESSGSDVNLEDIALGYAPQPDDYFSHPERYSQNTPHGLESVKAINTAIDAIKNGEKDVKVKVYRAVPTSVKEGKLRNGDWVTPSKKYAEMHGTNRLEGKYRIIEDEVPATQLWWDGNDANEFGFDDGKEYKYKNAKNNRKLNDLVTYDNKGDVIPPSKRFNSRKSDVRFMFAGENDGVQYSKVYGKKANVKPRLGSATIGLKAAKDKVVELFHKAKNGEFNGKPQSIGTLTQEGKKFLEDLSGLKMKDKIDFVLNPSDLKHMNKDHFGDNEKDPGRNIPLTEEDLRSMVDVIMNPEQVVYGIEKMDNRKAFFFLKQAEDGTLNLAEIYSDKKGNLTAKSYYKTKKGVDQRVMEIKNSLLPTPEASSGSPLSDGKGINFFSIEQEKTAENERKIADSVVNTANKLGGAEATVYFSLDDVPEEYRSEVEQGAKGWYDPETHSVHVYLPNCEDGNDAQRTVFHEKIGHEGMEVLLGGEDGVRKFANFVYRSVGKDVRGKIIDFANKYDPDWKNPDRMNVGTQEYIAHLAEDGPKTAEDFSLWTKIKHYLIKVLKKLGVRVPGLLNDKDLRYYLMKAGKALHVWDNMPKEKQEAMMKQASNAEIKDSLSDGANLPSEEDNKPKKKTERGRIDEATGAFKLAPNGEQSNLSKKQYIEARTKNFKDWFGGDWEKKPKDFKNKLDANGEPLEKYVEGYLNRPKKPTMPKKRKGEDEATFFGRKMLYSQALEDWPKTEADWKKRIDEFDENTLAALTPPDEEAIREKYQKQYENDMASWRKDHPKIKEGEERPLKIPDMRDYQSIQDYGEALGKHEIWKTAPNKDEYERMAEDEIISKVALMDAVQHPFSEYARLKTMKAEFQHMRHVMQNQKVYDQNTTDAVVQFAKRFMSLGYGDDLGRGSINTLLTIVKNSTGKKSYEISQHLYQVMDVLMNNQLRNFDRAVMKTMSIKELKENAKGIQVQGKLELRGQTTIKAFRDAVSSRISSDKLDEKISNLIDKMAADKKNASSYQDELLGLNLAKQYVDYIDSSRNDAIEIEDMKRMEIEGYKNRKGIYEGELTKALLQEHVERLNQYDDALFNNKVERMERYSQLLANLGGMIDESVKGAREFQERDARRAIKVKMMASADLGGKSMNQHHKENWKTRLSNSDFVQGLGSPLGSFDALMREFGSKQINGEGHLWNHFVRGAMKASNEVFKSVREANNEIDLKVSELFGKVTEDKNGNKKGNMTLNDLYALERSNKVKSLDVTIRDIEGEQTYKLQQGNLMYIYMVNKMPDGAMKLRQMGILDADVERIKENIDPRFLKLADWIQGEFLPKMRTKYNKRHEELFGAPMPMVENYFPLRVLKNARYVEEDVNNTSDGSNALPSTATGAIIKRKINKLPLDILNADALSVTIDNINEMENWYNYAPIRKDANTLLSDTTFRNRVQNMTTIYGSGETLWNNVKDATAVAMGTYRPTIDGATAVALRNFGKGITGAKISFRLYTAFKQVLSAPLFLPDVDLGRFVRHSVHPYGSFKWAIENLPNFDKRWSGRKLGDTVLMDDPTDWKLWHTNLMEKAAYYGMTPNALVDAVTCAVGARAVYDTKYKQYIKYGLTEERAKEKALSDAEINFNTSQQSSEGAFVSPMQLDKTLGAAILTPFRNSSMLYERKGINALRNLKHRFEKGHKEASIKFMAGQLMEEGVGYEQATKAAEKMYKKGLMHNIADAIVSLWLGAIIWNLGGNLGYLMFGDDNEKKKKMVIDAVILGLLEGPVDGLAGGQFINTAIANTITSDGISLKGLKNVDFSGMPMLSDFSSMIEKFGYDKVAGAQDLMFIVMQSATGFNPKTLTDAINACIDYGNGDMTNAKEIALFVFRLMNGPAATVDNLYIDELGMKGKDAKKLSYEELAKRYAEYKFGKNTFGLGKLYSDEEKQKKLKAIEKSFDKKVSERLAGMDREDLKNEFSESRSQKEKKLIGKIIADELETKDSEAVKKAKADASYLRQRNFSDLMDDLYLQKEWEATNEANAGLEELKGNGASEKEIEAYKTKHKADLDKRKAIQEARKKMQKKKADISSDNDEATMAAIRKLRDSILKTVRQKKK
jgi:hypothetical protein